jgi:hypothetical protein
MKTHVMLHPRAEELLVERALRPLSEAEVAELDSLGVDTTDDSFDVSASAVTLATLRIEAMPDHVLARLARTVDGGALDFRRTLPGVVPPAPVSATSSAPAPSTPTTAPSTPTTAPTPVIPIDRARRRVSVAWVTAAAAAGVALTAGVGLYARRGGDSVAVPSEARTSLLRTGAHATAWTATTDAAAKSATGDVVWSDAEQRGYMRFVGLAVNDAKAWQYQLWIFDRTRDEAFPVDGGVFNVTSDGEVIVPISAKLHVDQATLFAVTVERPGGVVVSKRERIVVTAKPS